MVDINNFMRNKKELQGSMDIPMFINMPEQSAIANSTWNNFYNSNPDLYDNLNTNTIIEGGTREMDPDMANEMLKQYQNAMDKYNRNINFQALAEAISRPIARRNDDMARKYMGYMGVAADNPYIGQMASSTRGIYGEDLLNNLIASNRLAMQGKLQGVSDINAIKGNMVAAQEAGLNPAVAFGTKDQLSNLASVMKANIGAQAKRDVAQTYFDKAKYVQDAKTKIADLDRQFKYYKAKGDWTNALRIQAMKGAVQQNVASVMAGARIQGAGINALSNYLGMQDDIPSQVDMNKVIEVLKQYPEIFKQ